MLAITTKYLPATATRGSRLVASSCSLCACGQKRRARVSWDHELNAEDNHEAAALALLETYIHAPGSALASLRLIGSAETSPGARVHMFGLSA